MTEARNIFPSLFVSNRTGGLHNRRKKSALVGEEVFEEDDTARSWEAAEVSVFLGESCMPGLGELRDHLEQFKFMFATPQELLWFCFPVILALYAVFCYWWHRGSAEEFMDLLEGPDDVLVTLWGGVKGICATLLEVTAMFYGFFLIGGKAIKLFLQSDLAVKAKPTRGNTQITVNRLTIDAGFDADCQAMLYKYAKQGTILP